VIELKGSRLELSGLLTYRDLPRLLRLVGKRSIDTIDLSNLKRMDTSVAIFLLHLAEKHNAEIIGCDRVSSIVEITKKHGKEKDLTKKGEGFFYRLGYAIVSRVVELVYFFGFLGEVLTDMLLVLLHPRRIRFKAIVSDMERMGVNAIPIITVLSFLIGIVIAYQSAVKLQEFGANIFIVDLVSISISRELGPLIVAILLAGRSASSYTAQIGIMKVTEEVDVIRTMGLNPFDVLVFPKIVSMLISLPLLVVLADIMGILGGMLVAYLSLGISFYDFIMRLHTAMGINTFAAGLIKAPVFAFTIALIGCYKGFRTQKNVESIGKSVTVSVVDSIFAVIVIDAIFSVLFRWAGI